MENRYDVVKTYIKEQIETSKIKPGSKLPSIRELAEKWSVCNSTIISAYRKLEQENIIYAVPKSGYYAMKPQNTDISPLCPQVTDLSRAVPAYDLLPYMQFKDCLNQAIDSFKESLFTYSDPQGLEGLRNTLTKHYSQEQIFTSESNMIITAGAYQALFILTKMPFPNGNCNILVEQPTYSGMLRILDIENSNTIGIERNANGIDLEKLETIFRSGSVKFFYLIPRFQNPTGFSYTKEQKLNIISLAAKYNIYIVEDDYLADLETDTKNDSLFAMSQFSNVIYIRSFSKSFLPGIRIASVILPQLLVNDFLKYKKLYDIGNSTLNQAALQLFINSGMLEKHCKSIRREYESRMTEMKKSVEAASKLGFKLSLSNTGFFGYLELPKNVSSNKLAELLKSNNIYVARTKDMFIPCFFKDNSLRISVCSLDKNTINQSMLSTFQCIEKVMNSAIKNNIQHEEIFIQ